MGQSKALVADINVLGFLKYQDGGALRLGHEIRLDEFTVPVAQRPVLQRCKELGVWLKGDDSKSQGIMIMVGGEVIGHVKVFMNLGWLDELMNDLTALADDPVRWGVG